MITYRQVKLAETQTVIESFLVEQWEHTGDKHLPCNPNWPAYLAMEQAGSLVMVLACDDGRPIGYLGAVVHPHMNSVGTLVASIPTYFVENRPQRAMIMRRMIEWSVNLLKKRGVVQINVDTEWEHSAARLLGKLGFRPVKIGYRVDPRKECPNA